MIFPENGFTDIQRLQIKRFGPLVLLLIFIECRLVVQVHGVIGMLGAQRFFPDLPRLPVQRFGFFEKTHFLV